jgi:hypothetical protein
MNTEQLLEEISSFCRRAGMAESTFGRRVVNDGKLVQRLRHGGRITTDTLDRIRTYLTDHPSSNGSATPPSPIIDARGGLAAQDFLRASSPAAQGHHKDPSGNFRFFDNRQKYLLFVNTCS